MRNILAGIIVFAALLIGIRYMAFPGYESQVKTRVTNVLTGMQGGGAAGVPQQTAMAMWAKNKFTISDNQELNWASDKFDKWRREKKLYRTFTGFEITEVEVLEDVEPRTALVTFVIEGKSYKVKVIDGRPIEWAE
jgi:hypothetical protein